jgi:hypothetical protein
VFEVSDNMWVFPHDLNAEIPGRDDTLEERTACSRFLAHERGRGPRQPTAHTARQARAELVAARVRASAGVASTPSDVEQRLGEAKAAINRLLAFVPARAAAIARERLTQLVQVAVSAAETAFPNASRLKTFVRDEGDADTEACHRIEITATVTADLRADLIAAGVNSIHRALVAGTSPAERRAIRLIVDIEESAGVGSQG